MSFMSANFLSQPRISFVQLVMITRHMATMIKAGIPLTEVLDTLQGQSQKQSVSKVFGDIAKQVRNGTAFAEALKKYPTIFSSFYVSIVAIGEASGTLDGNLTFLADQLSKEHALRRKVQGAVLYPALVLASVTVMGGLISFFILPQLIEFFAAFEVELPVTTRILLGFAQFMADYGVGVLALLIAGALLFIVSFRVSKVAFFWHRIAIHLPLFGTMLFYGQLARFCRNFGVLLQSGVPVVESLITVSKTLGNVYLESIVASLAEKLAQGTSIESLLAEDEYVVFPAIMSKMVSVGERTGKLDESLLYLAQFYEDEIDNTAKSVTTLLEPVLLLGLGLGVGFVALAIITPIYELTGNI